MFSGIRFVSSKEPEVVIKALRAALFDDGGPIFVHAPDRPRTLSGPLPRNAAVVIETSGSTGSPKQVWFEKEALLASAALTSTSMGSVGAWWLVLPTHYIAGLQVVLRALVSQAELVTAPPGIGIVKQFKESLSQLIAARNAGQPVYSSMVPAQLHSLLDAVETGEIRRDDLCVFSRLLVGGGRIPQELVSRAAAIGLWVTKTYGMAETSGGCVWDGVPLEGVKFRVLEGQIALSGPMLAGGYLGGDRFTVQSFVNIDGERWLVSRDQGVLSEGRLIVTGRIDDVISSGGVKLNLAEVEDFLQSSGLVSDAIVVGIPDAKWGEVPAVFSVRSSDFHGVKDQVVKRFGPHVGSALFLHRDKIPVLSNGKTDRQELKEIATHERERSANN